MDTRKYLEGEGYDGYKFFGNHKKANNSYIYLESLLQMQKMFI